MSCPAVRARALATTTIFVCWTTRLVAHGATAMVLGASSGGIYKEKSSPGFVPSLTTAGATLLSGGIVKIPPS